MNDLKDWQKIGILGLFMMTLLAISLVLGELTEFFFGLGWMFAGLVFAFFWLVWNAAVVLFCIRILMGTIKVGE